MAQAVMPIIAENDNQFNIAQLLAAVAPSFGTGKTTTSGTVTGTGKQVSSIDPAVKAQSDALLASILGENKNADSLVDAILTRAKGAFAPAIGQSIASGNRAYSDTTLRRLANDAAARASAEAAAAKLAFIQGNNSTAAGIINNQVTNSRTVDTTENRLENRISQTAASPLGKGIGGIGSALMGYSLLSKGLPFIKRVLGPGDKKGAGEMGEFFAGSSSPSYDPASMGFNETFFSGADPADLIASAGLSNGSMADSFIAANSLVNGGMAAGDEIFSAMAQNSSDINVPGSGPITFTGDFGSSGIAGDNFVQDPSGALGPVSGLDPSVLRDELDLSGIEEAAEAPKYFLGTERMSLGTSDQSPSGLGEFDAIDETGAILYDASGAPATINQAGQFLNNSFADAGNFTGAASDIGSGGFQLFDAGGEIFGNAFEGAISGVEGFAGDALSAGFGEAIGGALPFAGPIINFAQGNIASAALGAVGTVFGGPIGGIIGSTVGSAIDSVICTELYRQGLISEEQYFKDIQFARENLSKTMLRGYRFWAIPYVRLMRKSSFFTRIACYLATERIKALEVKNPLKAPIGYCFRRLFEPLCFLIGLFVKEKDYSILYKSEVA